MKYYIGLCTIAKNETAYLDEWVRYHIDLGVNHILVFDNDSEEPIERTLREWIDAGYVTVVLLPGRGRQLESYQIALDAFGADYFWLGFIDLDEFIFLKRHLSLADFLMEYEPYGGVGLNWVAFGTAGYERRPTGENAWDSWVTSAYTMRLPDTHHLHFHIKSIVQPAKVERAGANPHSFWLRPGFHQVNELKRPIPNGSGYSYFTHNFARINHYVTKSTEEYYAKKTRGKADSTEAPPVTVHPPFTGDIRDESMRDHIHSRRGILSVNPSILRKNDVYVRSTKCDIASLLTIFLNSYKEKKIRDTASCLAALTVFHSNELSTPVKMKYLRLQNRDVACIEMAEYFFKAHYSHEVTQEYVAALCRLGHAELAQNIDRFVVFLKSLHGSK